MKRVSDVIREKGIKIKDYIPRPNICDLKPEEQVDLISPKSVERGSSPGGKANMADICDIARINPDRVNIWRKCVKRGSNYPLYSKYNFKVAVSYTHLTLPTTPYV